MTDRAEKLKHVYDQLALGESMMKNNPRSNYFYVGSPSVFVGKDGKFAAVVDVTVFRDEVEKWGDERGYRVDVDESRKEFVINKEKERRRGMKHVGMGVYAEPGKEDAAKMIAEMRAREQKKDQVPVLMTAGCDPSIAPKMQKAMQDVRKITDDEGVMFCYVQEENQVRITFGDVKDEGTKKRIQEAIQSALKS